MVSVQKKNEVHFQKPLLLLRHFTVTKKALEDTKQLQKIHKQSVSETYVYTNPALFGRSIQLLRKKPSDSQKRPSNLLHSYTANTHSEKLVIIGVIFFDTYHKEAFTNRVVASIHEW